jgi:hypothetical protein
MVLPEEQLWTEVNDGWSRMSFNQRNLWAANKRPPERWELNGYGPCWVVAILGETVIYYNHFEHLFNCSPWSQFGAIEQFHSLQSSLGDAVQAQLNLITTRAIAATPAYEPSRHGRKKVEMLFGAVTASKALSAPRLRNPETLVAP